MERVCKKLGWALVGREGKGRGGEQQKKNPISGGTSGDPRHGARPEAWPWVPRELHKQREEGREGTALLASRNFCNGVATSGEHCSLGFNIKLGSAPSGTLRGAVGCTGRFWGIKIH